MLREQLSQLIRRELDMDVCGQADNSEEAKAMIQALKPTIAIVDIGLRRSNGLDLVKELHAEGAGVSVLVLSMHEEANYAERALRAGAKGYVTKSEASSEVMRAIRKVLDGELYLSDRMTSELIEEMTAPPSESQKVPVEALADRELKVFQLIGEGKNTHEIARRMKICESTVAGLRVRIKAKIGVKDVAELYHRATEWMQARRHAAS